MLLFSRAFLRPIVRIARILTLALFAAFACVPTTQAQSSFTFSLFERYLNALREQAGIPGLAAAVVQDGAVVWERGFGLANIASAVPVTPDTPFPITQLTQAVGASLILNYCIESGEATLDDRVQRWSAPFPEPTTTFRQLLSHSSTSGFQYNAVRFAGLTTAAEECSDRPFPLLVHEQILDRFGMTSAVPGGDVAVSGTPIRQIFPTPTLNKFRETLGRMATGYRVDDNRRPSPSLYRVGSFNTGDGLVASVHDLALFEAALDAGAIVRRSYLDETVWVRAPNSPMGLGWFVQQIDGRRIVWHFGIAPSAYSALVIKVPAQRVTLVLLANSDGLSAQFPLATGDLTVSPFARIFLTLLG